MPVYGPYHSVNANRFANHYEHAYRRDVRMQACCTPPDEVNWKENSYFLAPDGNSGYAIKDIADELCLVFSQFKGRGDSIVTDAIARGAVCLTCFDGYLPTLYGRHNFKVVERQPNWQGSGHPDFLVMRREVF